MDYYAIYDTLEAGDAAHNAIITIIGGVIIYLIAMHELFKLKNVVSRK